MRHRGQPIRAPGTPHRRVREPPDRHAERPLLEAAGTHRAQRTRVATVMKLATRFRRRQPRPSWSPLAPHGSRSRSPGRPACFHMTAGSYDTHTLTEVLSELRASLVARGPRCCGTGFPPTGAERCGPGWPLSGPGWWVIDQAYRGVERVCRTRIWPTHPRGTPASRSHDHQPDTQLSSVWTTSVRRRSHGTRPPSAFHDRQILVGDDSVVGGAALDGGTASPGIGRLAVDTVPGLAGAGCRVDVRVGLQG